MKRILVSPDAAVRVEAAVAWLTAVPPDTEVLLIAAGWTACDDLLREAVLRGGTRFGTTRITLDRLAARLSGPGLSHENLAPATFLSATAVAARVSHKLSREGALSYYAPVAERPGFAHALARTLEELRLNRVSLDALGRLPAVGSDLARLAEEFCRELKSARLADRAFIFEAALRAAREGKLPRLLGVPTLFLDLPLSAALESDLLAGVANRSPDVLVTVPAGDKKSLAAFEAILGVAGEQIGGDLRGNSLQAVKTHLFEESAPPEAPLDSSVSIRSLPGEARECVEIARSIQTEAARGIAFDRMAILLRSPGEYRAHLQEALRRASIPAYFASRIRRPEPGGRAFLALLACAAEKLSARRFAEYLSLAQVPDPEPRKDPDGGWRSPEPDLVGPPDTLEVFEETGGGERQDSAGSTANGETRCPDPSPDVSVIEGALRAPWRWEDLLVEASVIGGADRWERRLAGLAEELRRRRENSSGENEAHALLIDRQLADLVHLTSVALPLIGKLAALPERALWGDWLERLRALAGSALREPDAVLATLAELEPMSPVGPVGLDEVRLVLSPRLTDSSLPPPRRRYGAVFVAPTDEVRGLCFDVVFVPGLSERLFPRKVTEDPILPDSQRETLGVPELQTQKDRVGAERLALKLAAGAARERLFLSYPRVDVERARARVPSFYGLEAVRAAEGRLPGLEEFTRRAGARVAARLGWPAPARPEEALDDAEYDLALLAPLLEADPETVQGTATYLMSANPHLARALRFRGRRWRRRWTPSDGLVEPDELAMEALAKHQLQARSFSPTSLQLFSSCPYKFLLQAVHRLQPREEPVQIETLHPLDRGALFHDVQFGLLSKLKKEDLLPVSRETLEPAFAFLEEVVRDVGEQYRDDLAPAIPRVWEDAIAGIRADLREWLRREAESRDGWVPHRFELTFGVTDRDRHHEDPASVPQPVRVLDNLLLRGSIDLVERHPSGRLRATDHKTGKVWVKQGVVVGGGTVLQPILYALAAEKLLEAPAESGRLYYCTADGEYQQRVVAVTEESRSAAQRVVEVIGRALSEGFLPAMPAKGECGKCDYRPVCGPYEEIRTSRKPKDRLAGLEMLRGLK